MDDPEDYKKTYREFWKPLVETDGKLDQDKVMRELHDYHFLIDQVPKVYGHVSGNKISKPNTYAFEVINAHDDQRQEDIDFAVQEAVKEALEKAADEVQDVFRLRGHSQKDIEQIGSLITNSSKQDSK